MNIEKIHNTTVNLPDREVKPGEVIENVQICPVGDFPNGDHQQHCTVEALKNVVKDWQKSGSKEILVDFEHNSESHEPNSDTSAAAWVSNVRVDPERGLVGDFKLTDVGAQAISNRRLRFLSVSWFVNKETHEPIRITSIALTNKPNIPVAPVLNKGVEKVEKVEEVEKSASQPTQPSQLSQPTKERNNMDKIKEALGLAPEATEEQVLEAITAMVKANKDAEEAALEKEAEDFAEKNSKKCNKEVLKAQYLANKEVAMALVAGIPDAPAAHVVNKGDAKKPTAASFEQNRAGAESDEQILNKYESLSGKAKDEYLEQTQEWRDTKRPDGSDHLSHFKYDPKKPDNIPLTEDDLDMLPSLWRNPDWVVKLTGERFQSEIDAFDGSTYCLQIAIKDKDGNKLERPQVWTFFKTTKPLSKRIGLR